MRFLLVLLALVFAATDASSIVWEDTNKWSVNAEKKYQKWVKDAVKKNIFTDPKSPYYHLDTDCADMIYSLRAIFAYENKLPFKIKNTLGTSRKYYSNRDSYIAGGARDRADKFPEGLDPEFRSSLSEEKIKELKGLRVFLNWINENIADTYGLAFRDTLPVDPKKVAPGDIYVSPVKTDRHSYMIKDISPLGHFHLLYDTLMVQISDLFLLKGLPKYKPTGYGWGMKRFIPTGGDWETYSIRTQSSKEKVSEAGIKRKNESFSGLMKYWGFSFNQYKYINDKKFFSIFFQSLQLRDESIDQEIKRKVQNICTLFYQRSIVVDDALRLIDIKDTREGRKYFDQNGCFNPESYRKLSTPSRDATTMAEIVTLFDAWDKYVELNPEKHYSREYQDMLVPWFIWNDYKANEKWGYEKSDIPKATVKFEQQLFKKLCAGVSFENQDFKVSDFIWRYRNPNIGVNKQGQEIWVSSLSTNPNDNYEARWGFNDEFKRNQCPNYDEEGELVRP